MNKEQYQEFLEFTMNIYANRDAYSRGKIIEDIRDKVTALEQSSFFVVGQSQTEKVLGCQVCGETETKYFGNCTICRQETA